MIQRATPLQVRRIRRTLRSSAATVYRHPESLFAQVWAAETVPTTAVFQHFQRSATALSQRFDSAPRRPLVVTGIEGSGKAKTMHHVLAGRSMCIHIKTLENIYYFEFMLHDSAVLLGSLRMLARYLANPFQIFQIHDFFSIP